MSDKIVDLDAWRSACLGAFENLSTDTPVTMAQVSAVLLAGARRYASGGPNIGAPVWYEQIAETTGVTFDDVDAILCWRGDEAAKLLADPEPWRFDVPEVPASVTALQSSVAGRLLVRSAAPKGFDNYPRQLVGVPTRQRSARSGRAHHGHHVLLPAGGVRRPAEGHNDMIVTLWLQLLDGTAGMRALHNLGDLWTRTVETGALPGRDDEVTLWPTDGDVHDGPKHATKRRYMGTDGSWHVELDRLVLDPTDDALAVMQRSPGGFRAWWPSDGIDPRQQLRAAGWLPYGEFEAQADDRGTP